MSLPWDVVIIKKKFKGRAATLENFFLKRTALFTVLQKTLRTGRRLVKTAPQVSQDIIKY